MFRYATFAIGLLGCLVLEDGLSADTVVLTPSADTTLIEAAPSNNNGGQVFFNAGTTQNFTRNRGLVRFDLTGLIPPGSLVTRADLRFEVVRTPPPNDAQSSTFAIHRLLQDWGEGDKVAVPGGRGLGEPATLGEATWTHRFAGTTNTWAAPGAGPGTDYVEISSSSQFIEFEDTYLFSSTERTVADVQLWVDHPEQNFGWLLRTRSESTHFTARQFGSREDAFDAPQLTVAFSPLTMRDIRLVQNQITFSFTARANQAYAVEFLEDLSATNWAIFTAIAPPNADTNIILTDSLTAPRRFYRVRQD